MITDLKVKIEEGRLTEEGLNMLLIEKDEKSECYLFCEPVCSKNSQIVNVNFLIRSC